MSDQRRSQSSLTSTFPTFLFYLHDSPLDCSGRWDRATSVVGYVIPLANQVTAKGFNASTCLFSGLQRPSGILFFFKPNPLAGNQRSYVKFPGFQVFVLATDLNLQPDAQRVSYGFWVTPQPLLKGIRKSKQRNDTSTYGQTLKFGNTGENFPCLSANLAM